jgi:hypothetical protein
MAHPIHLHGMFVQLENGQPLDKLPNKHTVIVPPGQTISVLLTADAEGTWAFHCHLMYHMLSGMMTDLVVEKPGAPPPAAMPTSPADMKGMSGMSGMDMSKPSGSGASSDMKGMNMAEPAKPDTTSTSSGDMNGMTMGNMDMGSAGKDRKDDTQSASKPMVMTAPDAKPTASTSDATNAMPGMDMGKTTVAKAAAKKKAMPAKKKAAPKAKSAPMKMDGMNMSGMSGMDMGGSSASSSKEASHAH